MLYLNLKYKNSSEVIKMELNFLNGKSENEIEQILADNPSLIQEGFQIKGRQKNVVTGRYDLFGIDKDNKYVVVEVKKGRASEKALAQIARYMGSIKEELYGIIFCQKASAKLKYALSVVDTIRLIEFGNPNDTSMPKTTSFNYQFPEDYTEFIGVLKSVYNFKSTVKVVKYLLKSAYEQIEQGDDLFDSSLDEVWY